MVWDLDNTLWDGILLEDDAVRAPPDVVEPSTGSTNAGVLHSIASRNDQETALAKLKELGLRGHVPAPADRLGCQVRVGRAHRRRP